MYNKRPAYVSPAFFRYKEKIMKYYEFKIYCSSDGAEKASDVLTEAGYLTFEVDDTQTAKDILSAKKTYEWDYFDESLLEEHEATVTLYFPYEDSAKEDMERIARLMEELHKNDPDGKYGRLLTRSRTADDSEWKDEWKKYFKPSKVTEDIVIKPSWEDYEAAPGEKIIEIDPGMAFGTGTHATTRMCIKLIEEYLHKDDSFLDIGCGSGILSIAAGLTGCRRISGFDIDPDAVEAARENAAKNHMEDFIKIFQGDVTQGTDIKADVAAGNLMAEIIMSIAGSIPGIWNDGGIFIASGIITEKRDAVLDSLKDAGLDILKVTEEEGWCAVAAEKKA